MKSQATEFRYAQLNGVGTYVKMIFIRIKGVDFSRVPIQYAECINLVELRANS